MVFKGTHRFAGREISKLIQSAGATINAYTTFDRTVFHIDGPAECAKLAFDVLSEMMFHANLHPNDSARELDVILREIDMRDDDPDSLFSEAVLAEAFHVHPYRFPVIGLRDVFSRITHKQLLAYYKARYVPNNMVVTVAGTLSHEEVLEYAKKYFGGEPASALGAPNVPEEPAQIAPRNGTLYGDVRVLRGCIAWRIPGMRDPDAPALDVFSMLIGLGESSRLHRKLHHELGLVHEIDASCWTPGAAGLLWISYTADLGKREAIEAAIHSVFDTALADGFDQAEFAKARRACLMAFLESRKTVFGIASQLGAQAVIVGDLNYPQLYLSRVQSLTPEDVLAAVRKHIRIETSTTYAMEPKSARINEVRTALAANQGPVLFEEVRLPNGLRVLLQPMHSYPKVNVRVMLPGGGLCESENRRGLCALFSTLLTRDTENRTATAVAEAAENLGASLHETAGNNSLGVSIEVLPNDFATGTAILADGLLHPALTEKTFFNERDAQRSALEESDDDIVEYGKRRLRELFFGKHPLAIGHLGSVSDLAVMLPSDVRSLHSWLIRPENCVLAVSGDFDRDAVLADLTEKFGNWPSTGAIVHDAKTPPPPPPPDLRTIPPGLKIPARTGRITETRPHSQAIVFMAFPDAGIADDEYVAGQLLDELLSGTASRLFASVREERGMAYFVGASRVSSLREGMFFLFAGTIPVHVNAILQTMRAELMRVRMGEIDHSEIEAAKAHLRTARRMASQAAGVRTMNAALNALYGLEVNRDVWWEKQLDEQNASSLAAFARKYLCDDKCLEYIVLPEHNDSADDEQ